MDRKAGEANAAHQGHGEGKGFVSKNETKMQ